MHKRRCLALKPSQRRDELLIEMDDLTFVFLLGGEPGRRRSKHAHAFPPNLECLRSSVLES